MLHRLLIIDQPGHSPLSMGEFLEPEEAFHCQHTNWDSCPPDKLIEARPQLIVAVALAQPEKARNFFHWLRSHPIVTPVLGILPNEADEGLLRAACETTADFVLWPAAFKELRHRVERLLGPPCHNTEETFRRLNEEMGLALLVGREPAFVQAIEKIPQIAASNAPVMLLGETGTGKELCARAIHHLSKGRSFPFIPVECGALPEHLVENELFGHARGAYTDAHSDQKGLVGMAEGGTLFLDEIDALSLGAQAKLLRFLQESTYRPLGAERFHWAQVRVIAATNRDLEAYLREQRFRPDLYFRLNVLRLQLPPLRERRGDIPLLARHFLERTCPASGTPLKSLTPGALRMLEAYDWPGNVRELFNVVQRAVVFSPGLPILPCHLPLPVAADHTGDVNMDFRRARGQAISAFEQQFVRRLLRRHSGNVTRAALEAGKDRREFGRILKKYGIDRQDP
jgi:DNA-binding NtrC family response regulator